MLDNSALGKRGINRLYQHQSEAIAQAPTILFLPNLHGAPQPLAARKSCRITAALVLAARAMSGIIRSSSSAAASDRSHRL